MPDKTGRPPREFSLIQLFPNLLTITALCAGLTAIRFGIHGRYEPAVLLILAAAVLDGVDGRLARALGSDSRMGAELDSLADFLNFGVTPPLVLYFWALQDMRSIGWVAVLVYAVCCVLRLARFNVASKAEVAMVDKAYFVGFPAPAGAILALLPMFVSFSIHDRPILPDAVISLHLVIVGLLMISRIPTWSFKTTRISRENVKFFLVGFAVAIAAVLTFAWVTLVVLCLAYLATVIWALVSRRKA